MKLSLTLSLLLGVATLFQGCGSTEDATKKAKKDTVVISGTTTRATIFKLGKATVCLDTNNNNTCDDTELQTTAGQDGSYRLTTNTKVTDGSILIVQGGINLLDGNTSAITLKKYYDSSEGVQNIHIMSTMILQELKRHATIDSTTYEEVLQQMTGNPYNVSVSVLLDDPLDAARNGHEKYAAQLAIIEKSNQPTPSSSKVAQRSPSTTQEITIPSDLEQQTSDYLDTFSQYLSDIGDYLSGLVDMFSDFWADDKNTEEVIETPQSIEVLPITRADLNGAWYIIDNSGDKTCSFINSSDNISVTEADGTETDLSLTFSQSDDVINSMTLKLGFFTADTINFTEYRSNQTFDGSYSSDGETLSGVKMSSYAECKSTKLGL
jgi:hypothetical protein